MSTAAIGLLALVLQAGTPFTDGAVVADRPISAADSAVYARGAAGLAGMPTAATLAPADLVWIERSLESLTLREKVAQLVVPYIDGGRAGSGTNAWRRARRLVMEDRVGGFIVGVGPGRETAAWLNELQSWSRVPLLMTADLEWGPGTRLRGATLLPINMAIAAAGGPGLAFDAGRITGLEARAAGLHMAFAPVADVNVNPANPVINTRAYGSDAAQVSERVVEFILGARSAGLLTVAKHFPGHGDTETDSHLALAVLLADRSRLDAVELAPFRAAIEAGVDGVMTAHMAVPALDPVARLRPATLSAPILTSLLREELGFGGLIVTDALHMDGVKGEGSSGAVAVAALEAGADILLMPPDAAAAIEGVVRAVRSGRLTEARIDHSVRRVLAAKAASGLHHGALMDLPSYHVAASRAEHLTWARETAERSITLVRGEPGGLPLAVGDRLVLTVVYDDRTGHRWGAAFEDELTAAGARVMMLRLSRRSSAEELERARWAASMADATVFASFSRALPWRGDLGLPPQVAALADQLAAGGATVLSFGDPYLLRQIPSARTYILAWSETDASQRAAARALTGSIPITGILPIDLPPHYPSGHGLMVPSLPGITIPRAR
jgi:beta-N-acetylhexosaminidase